MIERACYPWLATLGRRPFDLGGAIRPSMWGKGVKLDVVGFLGRFVDGKTTQAHCRLWGRRRSLCDALYPNLRCSSSCRRVHGLDGRLVMFAMTSARRCMSLLSPYHLFQQSAECGSRMGSPSAPHSSRCCSTSSTQPGPPLLAERLSMRRP